MKFLGFKRQTPPSVMSEQETLAMAIKRSRKNIEDALALKPLFEEREYLEDEEISTAFSVIEGFEEEIDSDAYDSFVYGLKQTIWEIESICKNYNLRISAGIKSAMVFSCESFRYNLPTTDIFITTNKNCVIDYDKASELAVEHGFSKLMVNQENKYLKFGRDEEDKEVFEKRIATVRVLHEMLEDGEGCIQDLKNRVLEIDLRISGALQIVENMYSLIQKGHDPKSMQMRVGLSKYFEPLDLEE